MLNNIFFYLPMGYLLKTRLNSLAKFISWNIIYVFPLFYLAYIKLNFGYTKLLQKSGMRKNVVIDLIYRGFI